MTALNRPSTDNSRPSSHQAHNLTQRPAEPNAPATLDPVAIWKKWNTLPQGVLAQRVGNEGDE